MYFNPFRVLKNYFDHFVVFVTLRVFSKFEAQRYFCHLGCFSISFTLEVLIGGFRVISFIILLYRFQVYFGDFENSILLIYVFW